MEGKMGNTSKARKRSASRPAGAPPRPPQPSHTGYVGPSPVLPLEATGMPPIVENAGADDPYALVGWGEASGIGGASDVRCPSGQLALVKRPGVQGLIEAGVLHDVDSLTGLVDQKHLKRVKGGAQPEINAQSLMKDPEQLERVVSVVDKVLVYVVVKPKLHLTYEENEHGTRKPIEVGDRKKGLVYTDQVELDDKMFIFNYAVGGTRSLERFRKLSADAVAGVDSEQDVEDEAE